jgi:KUP system potassium uptake protein
VPGTAVFLVSHSGFVPTALLRNLEHNHVCHEHIVILHLEILRTPRQDRASRAWVEELQPNVHAVRARFGFMETPDVPKALQASKALGWTFDLMSTSFFISRRALRPAVQSRMPRWQEKLFIRLARNASDASEHFRIPSGRTIEVGSQVTV